MNTFAPLWSGIVDSSIWDEPDPVRILFTTMLASKDSDHVVRKTAYQLGRLARYDEATVLDALKVLSSPDTKRLEKQEFDGRRIKAVEDGWLVLNGEKYRKMVSDEMRKARLRKSQAAFRARAKELEGKKLGGNGSLAERLATGDSSDPVRDCQAVSDGLKDG